MLGTAIRKSNGVRSSSVTGTITSLSSIESRLGVVISNSVGVGVRRRLIRVSWLSVVGRGGVDNGGVISWSSMDSRGVIGWGMVDNRGGMVSSKMSDWSVSTVCWLDLRKSLRVIYLVDRGVGSSKSLGLDNASLFSIRSGD